MMSHASRTAPQRTPAAQPRTVPSTRGREPCRDRPPDGPGAHSHRPRRAGNRPLRDACGAAHRAAGGRRGGPGGPEGPAAPPPAAPLGAGAGDRAAERPPPRPRRTVPAPTARPVGVALPVTVVEPVSV